MRNIVAEHTYDLEYAPAPFCQGAVISEPIARTAVVAVDDPTSDVFQRQESFAGSVAFFVSLLPIPVPSIATPLVDKTVKAVARAFHRGTDALATYGMIIGLVFSAPILWALAGGEVPAIFAHLVDEIAAFRTWLGL